MKKKHSFKDKLILCTLIPVFILNIVFNSVSGYWNVSDIILRIVGLLIYGLATHFYTKVFKSDTNLWLFTVVLSYILLIENLSVAFGEMPNGIGYSSYPFIYFK